MSRTSLARLLVSTLFALAALGLTLSTASAQELAGGSGGAAASIGKIGVGYTNSNAPVGVRMWFSPQYAFDAGLGFIMRGNERDHEATDPDDTTTTTDFALDLGFLAALYRGNNASLFGRVGLNFDRDYADGREDDGDPVYSSVETLTISGMVGMELFLGAFGFPELALQGAVGLGFENVSPAERVGDEDSDWAMGTLSTGVSVVSTAQLGFHFYF